MRLGRDGALEAGFALLAASLAEVVAVLVYRPWRALDAPFSYAGDASFNLMVIKGVLDHGWYERNPSLGAPSGQQLFDYPVVNGDDVNVLAFKVLGLLFGDAASVMNIFFLLTFPLAALAGYLVLRRLDLSREAALCCSVLFALLPYHFLRGESHLFLSAYYAVPIGAYLVLSVLGGRPLLARRSGAGPRLLVWASRRTVWSLTLCLVLAWASGSFYYSAFTVVLLGVSVLVRLTVARDGRAAAVAGICVATIAGASLIALAPALVYRAQHGENRQVGHHYRFESELYGVKLAELILPPDTHRVGILARLRHRYDRVSPPTEARAAALGLVAGVGFIWLLGVAIASVTSAGRRLVSPLQAQAAVLALVAFLIATTGGFSVLISAVWPQIRAWNRLSIFIAFFSLLAVGLLLDALRRRAGRALGLAAVVLVLAVGLFDQTSGAYTPPRAIAAEFRADAGFVHAIERRLPDGAMVYELPYVGFPETTPPAAMATYDLVRGYLHSDRLRWSFGAIRNRPEDRAAALAGDPVSRLVPAVRAMGFRGIYVDRAGYADSARHEEGELTNLLGPPLVSAGGRFSFFELR